jgi:ankyrin repeat protein
MKYRNHFLASYVLGIALLSACSNEHPQLIQALIDKDYVTMEALLKKGVDPNQHSDKRPWGHAAYTPHHTALSLAAAQGDQHAVRLMLKYKADRHEKTDDKRTPFIWALQGGHILAAKTLWDHEPHSGYVSHGTHGLVLAAGMHDDETYQYLGSQLTDERYIRSAYFYIAMRSAKNHAPLQAHAENLVSFLSASGDKSGPEALTMAMTAHHPKLIELLLIGGADPNALFDMSFTEELPRLRSFESISRIYSRYNGNTPLMALTHPEGLDSARVLLQGSANINALNSQGQNALMYFVATSFLSAKNVRGDKLETLPEIFKGVPSKLFKQEQLPVLEFHLTNGARIDIVDKNGKTLLDLISLDDYDAEYKRVFLSGE